MSATKLPNFLIVGAAKCGTSSLHNYLNQHSDIFLPSYTKNGKKVKEPRFLIKNLVKDRLHDGVWSIEEYQDLFVNTQRYFAVGESTVLYLYFYEEAIKNIKKYLGEEVKIIIMLRNPIDRAFSAYNFLKRKGVKEQLSFDEALKQEPKRMKEDNQTPMILYKSMGMYYDMVNSYLKNFKHVHIIYYDDFKNNTNQVVDQVLSFLGASNNHNIDTTKQYNVGGKNWRYNWLRNLFLKDNFIKKISKYLVPNFIRKRMAKILISFFIKEATEMKKETRKELIDFFKQDVIKLSNLVGKNLDHWIE